LRRKKKKDDVVVVGVEVDESWKENRMNGSEKWKGMKSSFVMLSSCNSEVEVEKNLEVESI
jgi:hypothetical protein